MILTPPDCPPSPSPTDLEFIKQESSAPYEQTVRIKPRQEAQTDKVDLAPQAKEAIQQLEQTTSPIEATAVVSEYTQQAFGFPVELSLPNDAKYDVVLDSYKASLQLMLRYTSILPQKLVEASNTSKIIITDLYNQTKDKTNAVGTNTRNDDNKYDKSKVAGIVRIDINSITDPSLFVHEVLGHGLEHSVCLGTEANDKAFTSLNPSGFQYKEANDGKKNNVSTDHASTGVTSSGYGNTNSLEDYACQTQEFIAGGDNTSKAIITNTAQGRKLEVVLARMEKIARGSVHYLRQIQPVIAAMRKHGANMPPSYVELP